MVRILKLAVVSAALAAALVTMAESWKAGPSAKADRAPVAAPAPGVRTGEAEQRDVRPVRVIPIIRKEAAVGSGHVSA